MQFIIFDFECYKYDTLLGALILHDDGKDELFQLWDLDEIRDFYEKHKEDLWIGHNNLSYDDHLLCAIVEHKDPYEISKQIINGTFKRKKTKLYLYSYDLMTISRSPFSLKLTELICGRNIHTTDVDFDIERELTDEERKLTEEYNYDDLRQTKYNFEKFYNQFRLRIQIIKNFNLDLMHNLRVTGTQLAANVLGAHNDPTLKYKPIPPTLYPTLDLKNERLKQFYLNEEFRKGKKEIIKVGNADVTIGAGGLHSAIQKYHASKVMYFDVSGYYNLCMINLNLLPRTMPPESVENYIFMYHEQLRLKAFPERLDERAMYKTILLSVFGAMNNEYTDFYDPWKGLLVTITGQLFLVDLMEKLEDLVLIVQANTDGIMVIPYNWADEQKVKDIVVAWEKRTGFVIKKDYLYNLWQRDVNSYCCTDKHGEVTFKGDLVNYLMDDIRYASCKLFDCSEPSIIAKGVIDYLIFGVTPEETVDKYKEDLKLFQYACKKNTFHYLTEDKILLYKNEKGKPKEEIISSSVIKPLNRAFAGKAEYVDGLPIITIITKHKDVNGKHSQAKVANLPDSVFIYNGELDGAYEQLKDKINWQAYIDRIYDKILTYIPDEEGGN